MLYLYYRKKKLLWQLGTLVGAPVGIALLASIAVPAMIIGIPSWVGRKIHDHYKVSKYFWTLFGSLLLKSGPSLCNKADNNILNVFSMTTSTSVIWQ